MLALAAVWVALASLALAITMVVYRPAFCDINVTLVLYFGSPAALCFAGLVLWAFRKETDPAPAMNAQRLQAKTAMTLAIFAAAIVYALVMLAEERPVIEG